MRTGSPGRWGIARGARLLALAIPLALAVVVGCFGSRAPRTSPKPLPDKVWENHDSANDYHDADVDTVSGLALAMRGEAPTRPNDKPLNVLCVSGGGKYAAFPAGVLCGWTATGTRPPFDVATGVSSGSPVALMAFLGPKYDQLMAETFLNLRRSDVYVWRPVRGLVTGNSLMSSRPLAKLFDREINDEAIVDIRAAHTEGRRLFVATTNVRTHKLVVWDIGALACSGRPDATELVRKVFLAACSIPGLVPPVEFDVMVNGVRYTEYHGDAGNVAQIFVRTAGPLPPSSSVWILSAGKSHPDPIHGRPRVLESMVTAVSAGLYALFRADAMKAYAFCGVTRSRFHLLSIPQSFKSEASSSMVFHPGESRRMYWTGYQMAISRAWQTHPPDSVPDEVNPPRAGLDFVTAE